jgi:ABC-type branched-subunit amino acid transport system ATPase component
VTGFKSAFDRIKVVNYGVKNKTNKPKTVVKNKRVVFIYVVH